MSSSEAQRARRIARYYGKEVCSYDRPSRIVWLQSIIAKLNETIRRNKEQHLANCERCQQHKFCLAQVAVTPEWERIRILKGFIETEQADEEYATIATIAPVDYKTHIDGFCAYWQNLRARLFEIVEYKCESCGKAVSLDCDHRHYDTLGFEEVTDVQALCRICHRTKHGK